MPHHVYANSNEIASKSADGKSAFAFPDVCISPGPPPPPGGIPIPYPNTCFAKDLTKITKTVFIKGMGAALENHSYFSTSTGDEPATYPLKKGIVSSKITGKCYFQSWSMNVKAEGKGVARHVDLVTHNHGNPSNTPPIYYLSIKALPSSCKKDKERMDKLCGPDKNPRKKKKRRGIPKGKDTSKSGGWVLEHCGPLLVPPGIENFDKWMEDFGDLDKLMKQATDVLKSELIEKLEKEIAEFAAKKALAFAARRGLTGWIPVVGWVISAADLAYTGYQVATNLSDMKSQLADLKQMVSGIQEQAGKVKDMFAKYKDDLSNFKNLSPEKQKKIARDVMTGVQTAYGTANPCMRARKCFLVPYKKTNAANSWAGNGCCPGQTGHHVLPDAMFRSTDKAANDKAFKDFKNDYKGKKPKDEQKPADIPRDKKPKR